MARKLNNEPKHLEPYLQKNGSELSSLEARLNRLETVKHNLIEAEVNWSPIDTAAVVLGNGHVMFV